MKFRFIETPINLQCLFAQGQTPRNLHESPLFTSPFSQFDQECQQLRVQLQDRRREEKHLAVETSR
jgi:hypothetical protein